MICYYVQKFIASLDADLLKLSAAGVGTNNRSVIEILCCRTKSEMEDIDFIYRSRFQKSLYDFISSEISGDELSQFLTYMQMSESELDAFLLRKAFSGMGCDTNAVIEIMCTRDFARLQGAKYEYMSISCINKVMSCFFLIGITIKVIIKKT